ncbi:hypothetical protein [Streptomyces pinistramenti]|uniref:hypothetical protein n=1 Tax=Streptomyces pinistramenti TaxID=2884812 RepID=UPI001D062CD9|nr:hypothetical protein [Streptomyces pinistramenti]MCB5911662.1 hypothetical protein [Streptomyces pinistramenti]
MPKTPDDIPNGPLTTPRTGLCGPSCRYWVQISRALNEGIEARDMEAVKETLHYGLLHKVYGHPEDPRPPTSLAGLYDLSAIRAAFLE